MPNRTKEQNDAILLENTNIIVSAGAGSGKTFVLTERVLNKLKNKVNIDELLILTFTNAAASEMKERIRKKIEKDQTLKSQLDIIDSAYITTFDSYALSLVKKYNYLLNVSKNISIIDDSIIKLKKDEILDQVFEDLYEEQNESFLKLIDDFYTKDDTEFKKKVLNINNKLDLKYDKNEYLNNYIDHYYCDSNLDKIINEYEDYIFEIISSINNDFIKLEEYVSSEYYESCRTIVDNLLFSKTYNDVKDNLNKLPRMEKNAPEEAQKIKKNINDKIDYLIELCEDNKEEIKQNILKTKEYTKTIIDIIIRFDKKINEYKSKIDKYEFNDIAKMAIKLLAENKKVRDEIKYSLNEIMIDEYQDTSDLQDLFISYIENNNVYMVGDIKQSIYRFRNANPNLFKQKYNNYSKNIDGIKIDLNKNFRSRKEVLNNINLIFENIMTNDIGGAEYKESHKMEYGNEAYDEKPKKEQNNNLEILNYTYDKEIDFTKEEIEIFIVVKDIKNKIENKYQVFDKDKKIFRDIEYSDIAILMDRSKNFELYKKIFEYLNVPMNIYKDNVINDSVDLLIIKNILSLFINKQDNIEFKYSFISVLRSYLFNLSDQEIFKHFKNEDYNNTELLKIINSINIDSLTIVELFDEIISKFNFYNKMITVGDIKMHLNTIDALREKAISLTELGYTINEFYNYLNKIIEEKEKYKMEIKTKEEKNGVKIMTIHASKGLEYHICYYTGLHEKFNIREISDRFVFDNKYGIITPIFDNGIRKTIIKELLKKSYLKEEISEKIRLFYVALTRAKEKMIIVTDLDNEKECIEDKFSYRSFLDILNSIKESLVNYIVDVDLKEVNLTKDYNYIKKSNFKDKLNNTTEPINVEELKMNSDFIDKKHFSKESHKIFDIEQSKNIEYGKKIHEIFEYIDFKNPDYSNLSKFEKDKVEKFINTGILKGAINIYKEYEFMYTDDVLYHGIIDLLLEFENEFKIVDYKLKNINDEEYLKQLTGYKTYLEKITNKKVSIYLYSIIDSNLKKI